MTAPVAVTDSNFVEEVERADIPVVVDFWAEWCAPCKAIGPALEQLAEEYAGRVKIAKIDIDRDQQTASRLGVRSIPSLFIFKDGSVVSNRAGAVPVAKLRSWIEEAVDISAP